MLYLENKTINRRILNLSIFLVATLFLVSFISAQTCASWRQPVKRGEDLQIWQTCNNCTYCNFTFFTPSDNYGEDYTSTSLNNWRYFTNLTGGNSSELGVYRYDYNCGNAIDSLTGCIEFSVNSNGYYSEQSQSISLIAQLGLIGLFLILGFSYNRSKWKIKTFFFLCSVLMGIVTLNSINIIFGVSEGLYKMGQVSITIAITVFGVMILSLFINMTIEIIDHLQLKKKKKWRMNDYA